MKPDVSGVVLQRDGKRYGVMTQIPAGIISPEDLEKIASIGRKFKIPVLKMTSGQRILLAGVEAEDVAGVLSDLGPLAKPETGPCVKYVQACLGTDMCRWGSQDSVSLARIIEEKIRDQVFPAKVKIGVSGCQRCCSESQVRDIGVIATINRWMVFFGGNGGTKPRIGDPVAWNLSSDEVVDCVQRLLKYYRLHAKPRERTARFMERIGMDTLNLELLSFIPYIPVDKV